MGSRQQLHSRLKELTDNVYFQPPAGYQMAYPCFVYKIDTNRTEFADNVPYRYTKRYMLTVITGDADSLLPDQVAMLPQCVHDRTFPANNLYHHVFLLYF